MVAQKPLYRSQNITDGLLSVARPGWFRRARTRAPRWNRDWRAQKSNDFDPQLMHDWRGTQSSDEGSEAELSADSRWCWAQARQPQTTSASHPAQA